VILYASAVKTGHVKQRGSLTDKPIARRGNNLQGFEDFHLRNGSSHGHNLALTVRIVPNSFDSAYPVPFSTVAFYLGSPLW